MKSRIIAGLIVLLGLVSAGAVMAPASYAASGDFFGGCKSGVDCSVAKTKTTLNTQIWNIVRTVLIVLGGVAVIVIIIGGIMYATSAGDPSQVTAAKNTILYAAVGLLVAMSASAIITLVNNYFG